jgi:hypothetical protein
MTARATTPEDFFAASPLALAVFERVRGIVDQGEVADVRVTKSQVAFRHRRGFAYLWLPGQYLRTPAADVVLSIALGRHDRSPRFKEVSHPSSGQWMHHLEIRDLSDVDDEVAGWLQEAADRAR